jgi:hypothetical protein
MVSSPLRRCAPRGRRLAVLVPVLALALAGCSHGAGKQAATPTAAATRAGTVIHPASLTVGQPIALPTAKPLFTMTGDITSHNQGGTLVLDRATLERLEMSQVRLYEPWIKKTMEFRGVWLQDLLAVAGVDPGATGLHIVALDDYAVDISVADVRKGGIMLALRAGDGSIIPISDGGPSRIVFLNGVQAGVNPDQWVWSIKSITVT